METIIIIIIILFISIALFGNKQTKKSKVLNNIQIGKMVQLLETVHILENTTRFEVFSSRYKFLYSISSYLLPKMNNSTYILNKKTALQKYNEKYIDHSISILQNDILINPAIALSVEFSDKIKVLFFQRFCNKMDYEISSLKTKVAKDHRRDLVLCTSKQILSELNHKQSVQYHSIIIDELRRFGYDLTLTIE